MAEAAEYEDSLGCVSDCESSVSGPVHAPSKSHTRAVARIHEHDREYMFVEHRLFSNLGPFSQNCRIVAAYKNKYSTASSANQPETFRFSSRRVMEMRGGDPNIKYAWYGSSRDGVGRIICGGFRSAEIKGSFGLGLHLSPENQAIKGIATSTADGHGLRHLLLCKVILGRSEQVLLGSKQSSPSSEEFDSGVDDHLHPTWYVIWDEHVKTHVLPMYVITLKLGHPMEGEEAAARQIKKPTSPWIPLGILISMLSLSLPPHRVCLIKRLHNAYMERKLPRLQLIHQIRRLTGDSMLRVAIKAFQDKKVKADMISANPRSRRCRLGTN